VVHSLAEVLFTELKASLQIIGLTSLFHLPWNLKFLWGPYLDAYGTKRRWIVGAELLMVACLLGLAVVAPLGSAGLGVAAALFAILALVAATHDVAIDGYYLEALGEEDQARFVGLRAPAYRVSMLVVSGPTLILIKSVGWFAGFAGCAVLLGLLFTYHLVLPPAEVARRPMSRLLQALLRPGVLLGVVGLAALAYAAHTLAGAYAGLVARLTAVAPPVGALFAHLDLAGGIALALLAALLAVLAALPALKRRLARSDSFYAQAFMTFLGQPQVGRILAFVVLFRAGESFLMKMKYPFLKSVGLGLEQYGLLNGVVGMIAALVAPALGGYLIGRHGLRAWIWPFVVAQNALNLLYMAVAMYADAGHTVSVLVLGTVITVEMFGAGLGTAVFMVYLMRCTLPEHRAAHMAVLTALMSVSFTLAGVASGFLAEALGFAAYFGFTFVATLPGMALIFVIPHLDARPAAGR
jgi:PAT family beta-lactamase induction signal transducer AmpG